MLLSSFPSLFLSRYLPVVLLQCDEISNSSPALKTPEYQVAIMMERCPIHSYLGHSYRLAKAGLKQLIASAGCLHDATRAYQEHVHAVKQVHLFIYRYGDEITFIIQYKGPCD